jgi:tRNA nucleotidyltransferase/poly(A) polymerase
MIKLTINFPLAKIGLRIVKALQADGFKAFWVGGTVRDIILNRSINNLDMATSAKPDQIIKTLSKLKLPYKDVGGKYGTILTPTKYGPVEITTFRTEGEYVNRRKPKTIQYIDDYLPDSQRRDLTINAIYYDPVSHNLLDPQNGLVDIERGLIKFVGDPKKRINEDALRLIRAVRFATQLSFKIEKNSFAAIKTRAKFVNGISGDRIRQELEKILIDANRVRGITELNSTGLLKFIMPEVYALQTVYHKSKKYHLEGSVFEHTMLVLQNITATSLPLAYAALYHDAGKYTTATPKLKDGIMVNSFPGHEFESAKMFKNLAGRIKISRNIRELVLWITSQHMKRIAFIKDMRMDKKLALINHKHFPYLLEFWRADSISNLQNVNGANVFGTPYAYQEGLKLLKKAQSKSKTINKLTNGDLIQTITNLKPGPKIKKIKLQIFEKIIDDTITNLATLKKFLKNYTKNT